MAGPELWRVQLFMVASPSFFIYSKNMIIDTHSHLNFKVYDEDRAEVIARSQREGIVCIDVGVDYDTSKKAVELAEKYNNIFASIGLHPTESEEFNKNKYLELVKSKRVVAVGEIGLDYFRNKDKERQKEIFIKQLELAEELNLPVIIHCRNAHEDVIEILENYKLNGVVHCFTGNLDDMQEYLKLNFYIGINGIILKQNLDEVIKQCPLNKILTETDCPFLGKEKRNEPGFVKEVIKKIAQIKKCSFEEVASATFQNAKNLFKI